jgi:nucleoside-diphosphate-sugar epimerase
MEGKKVLVTGASGLVGCALALELCKDNRVYGLARFRDAGVKEQLEQAGVSIVQKDVHRESLDDLPCDFDYVFSELAMTGKSSAQDPAKAHDVNTYFVGRLMHKWRSASGIILASTGSVYAPGPVLMDEDGTIGPVNTYAVSKLGGDVLGSFLCRQWQLPTSILRYYHPYGPTGGIPTTWATRIARGEEVPVNRKREPVYTPLYMSDVMRYTIEAARHCSVPAKLINVGGAELLSQTEIVAGFAEALGKEARVCDADEVTPSWVADVGLMSRLMGPPEVDMRDGLTRVARAVGGRT